MNDLAKNIKWDKLPHSVLTAMAERIHDALRLHHSKYVEIRDAQDLITAQYLFKYFLEILREEAETDLRCKATYERIIVTLSD